MPRSQFLYALTAAFLVSGVPAKGEGQTSPPRMVFVKGGSFPVGMTESQLREFKDKLLGKRKKLKPLMFRSIVAKRKQSVNVDAFHLDTHEVTNAEYKLYVDATGADPPSNWEEGVIEAGRSGLPVTMVSLRDAKEYARWAGKRIPTELEWEKAARGTEGRWFPWGNEWKDKGLCNNGLQPPADLTPVGEFGDGESPYKAQDMAGNVWEWTNTYIAPYPGNEENAEFNQARGYVLRGGCYRNVTHELATFIRNSAPAENGFEGVGFRCARSIHTGADATAFAIEEIASQLPPGSNIDPTCAVGIEKVDRQSDTGYVTSAKSLAIAPVGELNYSTADALDRATKKNGGSLALAVLTTDIAIAEPKLEPGSYVLFYQSADRRAHQRAAKDEAAKEKEKEKEKAENGKNKAKKGNDKNTEKESMKEDTTEIAEPSEGIPQFSPISRLLFVSIDGTRVAEIREPKFETQAGVQRRMDIATNLPPVGANTARESTSVHGVRINLAINPKFGSKSLVLPLVLKTPDEDLTTWN